MAQKRIHSLEELTQALAPVWRQAGLRPPSGREVIAEMRDLERRRLAKIEAGLRRQENRRHERKLLRDAKGVAWGEVLAEIPADVYFNVMKQKGLGPEWASSDEGLREMKKAMPACRVKTVGQKYIGTGWSQKSEVRSQKRTRRGAVFGRGTMEFAK